MTLNAHSLIEENYERKLEYFVDAVEKHKPDIIALQEVNQSVGASEAEQKNLTGYYSCQTKVPVREDNYAYTVCKKLKEKGVLYYWTWLPMKIGYGKYDEGLAVLSRKRIVKTDECLISRTDDYSNWKTRRILGVLTDDIHRGWFYSLHMSWWNDDDEPFIYQWDKIQKFLSDKGQVWLMGDFNNPAEIRGEGYDKISGSGWYDTYTLAQNKDNGITVDRVIDGWKDKIAAIDGMRIDMIWTNKKEKTESSYVIFNGSNEPVVSDHFGVIISVAREE